MCGALYISDNGCVRVCGLKITIAHENNNKNCEMATAFIVGSFQLCQKQLHAIRLIAVAAPLEGGRLLCKNIFLKKLHDFCSKTKSNTSSTSIPTCLCIIKAKLRMHYKLFIKLGEEKKSVPNANKLRFTVTPCWS